MMTVTRFVLTALVLGGTLAASAAEQNLVKNGDFSSRTPAGLPESWSVPASQKVSVDTNGAPEGAAQALRVDVVKAIGDTLGEIRQKVPAKPGATYVLAGRLRSTKAKMAVLAVKLIKGGKEVQRLASGWSGTTWTPVTCEFAAGEADEIQVLCRWRQGAKDKVEGQTAWFAALTLPEKGQGAAAATAPAAVPAPAPTPSVAAGAKAAAVAKGADAAAAADDAGGADTAVDLAPARAAPTSPATGPWADIIRQAASVQPATAVTLPLPAAAGDLYLTPAGSGQRDGHSWEHALPGNAAGVLQAAWNAVTPGHTVHLGSGLYVGLTLEIATGGTGAAAMKRLTGDDTGSGLPWLVGDWDPAVPGKGLTCVALAAGASNCSVEHLRLARYQYAVHSPKGRNLNLRFRDLSGYEMRFGFYLCGGVLEDEGAAASHDIEIADCTFVHFTKSLLRLQGGNYDVRVLNCMSDAGGTPWMKESFQVGYNIQGDAPRRHSSASAKAWASDHDIVFVNCVSRNCIWSEDHYWQGDGYCSERGVTNLAFINCASFDNADGGWDLKSDNVVYVNCTSLRNKMNWRLWGTAYLYNCLGANAFKRGGGWTSDGLWSIGNIHVARATFVNNNVQPIFADSKGNKTAAIALERCVVGCDGINAKAGQLYLNEARITKTDTSVWQPTADQKPAFANVATGKDWLGSPANAFDSPQYAESKQGYDSTVTAAWRALPPEKLASIGSTLLQHQGWDDLKHRIEAVTAKRP